MQSFQFITILSSLGFYSLAGCNKDTKDTSEAGNELLKQQMSFVSSSTTAEKERAREVIQRLQENVKIDLPSSINQQEELILEIEKEIALRIQEQRKYRWTGSNRRHADDDVSCSA